MSVSIETYNKPNSRINYIDGLRGFTMLLVVLGHVMNTSFHIVGYNSTLGSIILTFRMPMFFFISGYIAYKAIKYWTPTNYICMLKKKSIIQIIPATIFFSLFCIYNGISPIYKIQSGFAEYWFTIVLFEFLFIYYTISLICCLTNKLIQDIGLIIISIIGIMVLAINRGEGYFWDILCLENFCKYFQFFTLGILCKKYNTKFISLINYDKFRATAIIIFIISLVIYFNDYIKVHHIYVYKAVRDIIIRYSALFIIFTFFYHNRSFFDSNNRIKKTLLYIGKRTLDIYLLHYFFIPDLTILKPYIEPTNMMVIQLAISLTISSLIIGFSLFISNIIRTSNFLGHYLFGAKIYNDV